MASPAQFALSLPSAWTAVYKVLVAQDFIPIVTGGAVRDFLLTQKIGKDWDIEISSPGKKFDSAAWKSLGMKLSHLGKVSYLPYEVLRLDRDDYQFELSPPRIESFSHEKGHKNFSAEFDFNLSFEKSILRRDFTINAMGMRFLSLNEIEFLDPSQGLIHLRESQLYPVSGDFSKDPVRFLRAIRFAQKFKFQISDKLKSVIDSMPLENLPAAYLWSEMQKSQDPIGFYQDLLIFSEAHPELLLPVGPALISKVSELKELLKDPKSHEAWMVALEWLGFSCESWQKYFSVSSETARRLSRWAITSHMFEKISPILFQGEFDQVQLIPEFETLFDWYFTTKQILQKNPHLPLLEMINTHLPDWGHLYQFEAVKDVKHIDPPLRAKYQLWNLCQRL